MPSDKFNNSHGGDRPVNHCPLCGLKIRSVRTPGITDPWGRSPPVRLMVKPCTCVVPIEVFRRIDAWNRVTNPSSSVIGSNSGSTIQLEYSGDGLGPWAGEFDQVVVYEGTRPPRKERLRMDLDRIDHSLDAGDSTTDKRT